MPPIPPVDATLWLQAAHYPPRKWQCGYCGNDVASNTGYRNPPGPNYPVATILICGFCGGPTYFASDGSHHPTAKPGEDVPHLPEDLAVLYEEARVSAGDGAHTAAVLVCRKMLMHMAAANGADGNLTFLAYVEYLAKNGFIPPGAQPWVDYIRRRGNEATHELVVMTIEDSTALVRFVEMLLRFLYEFPALVPPPPPSAL